MNASEVVFISYASEDREMAARIVEALRAYNIQVWFDQDCLIAGRNWGMELEKAISSCRYFLAILSTRAITKRGVVQKEIRQALDVLKEFPIGDVYVIPVRLDDCILSFGELRDIQWVDMFPDWNKGITQLLKALDVNVTAPEETVHILISNPETGRGSDSRMNVYFDGQFQRLLDPGETCNLRVTPGEHIIQLSYLWEGEWLQDIESNKVKMYFGKGTYVFSCRHSWNWFRNGARLELFLVTSTE